MKKFLAVLLSLAMVLALVACNGGNDDKQPGGDQPNQGDVQPPAGDGDQTPAEPSGPLNVYTTVSELQYNAIMGAFQAKYPKIEINYTQAGAGDCKSRIQAEAGNPQGDIMFGGLVYADTLSYGDYFETYVCANDNLMPDDFKNNNSVLTYHDSQIPCLWINDDLEAEAGVKITGYKDLLDPKLKGLIVGADPTASSSAWNQLQCILTDFGGWDSDEAWDYIDKLMENMVITSSSSGVYKTVYDGEYVCGLTYEPACVKMLDQGAEGVHIVYPVEGVTSIGFGSAIIKGAKNMDNAKLFMDFLQSDECQAIYLECGARPATASKLDVTNDLIVDLDTINYLVADTQALAENQQAIFDRWNQLSAKHGN